MPKLTGRAIQAKYIEVHGQFGEFNLDNKKTKVRYFSTFASSKNKLHDSFALLKELKPMRERVKAKEISNLNSLLQRDLNDYRVANELVPYLVDGKTPVAFFPAILAILIPKGFISQKEESSYPTPKKIEAVDSNPILFYNDLWKLEIFKLGENESTLGILSIDPSQVDIIVLDGQHRANAFRVVSGTFSNDNNSIYSTFYKDIKPIESFNADLPVTIIWFDNDKPTFDPKIVSRRLFVDVNNNAKKVSQSRTILLDEYEIPSLLTRFFYSKLADERQFSPEQFSLFHSDFDLDSDINVSANNVFAITNPQIVYDIFSWLTLGRTEQYSDLNRYSVGREAFRNSLSRFSSIFRTESFSDSDISSDEDSITRKRVVIKDAYKIEDFEKAYDETLSPVLFKIYSNFKFFTKHFEASGELEKMYSTGKMDHTEMAVWEDVFMGGEGLYYTFKDRNVKENSNKAQEKYLKAIEAIEARFKTVRAKLFSGVEDKKVNSAFGSANTKAFQIGLFMALDYFREGADFVEMYEDFMAALNSKSEIDWVYILTDIRQKVINGTDPKRWPAYQKIILRAIQNETNDYYNSENYEQSPDYIVFYGYVEISFNSWLEVNDEIDFEDLSIKKIGVEIVSKWIKAAKENTESLFSRANIKPIPNVSHKSIGENIVNKLIGGLQ